MAGRGVIAQIFHLASMATRRGRGAAYWVVLIGFVVWVCTGLRESVALITLIAAAAAFGLVSSVDQAMRLWRR